MGNEELKSTGMTRRLDQLGRICIPIELRKVLELETDGTLEIFANKQKEMILKKYYPDKELKATGATRKLDKLGRICLPKETRKMLRLEIDELLEFFTNEKKEIVLKKYYQMDDIIHFVGTYIESIYTTIGHTVLISDRDKIVTAHGKFTNYYINNNVSMQLKKIMQNHEEFSFSKVSKKFIQIIEEENEKLENAFLYGYVTTIANGLDVIGSVIFLSTNKKMSEVEFKLAKITASFLSK